MSRAAAIRVGRERYFLIAESQTWVTDADIVSAVGPFTVPPGLEVEQPQIAYAVRGLAPGRYVAVRRAPGTTVNTVATVTGLEQRDFGTTGWALGRVVGASCDPDPELCPYIRAEFKEVNNCPP